ncbi:hypothetical protein SAMN05444365_10753 [Micromonospora pattaloongensis]|uniref:Uncharacterized protein n=1 Tax=Micromonospora pattaloongensis TaxID=405436 RepID=A0A1H3R6I5_9ACTN|nr:hypothetical protein [Micromonospora pattaloongensis]SDZ20579.1 hypothetical protein SAMN05444365_10753 [Micromonospora pattaloongensis]
MPRPVHPLLPGLVVAARLGWGGLLLLTPGRLTRPVAPPTSPAVATLRVLGARHLVQAATTIRWHGSVVFATGAAVDGIHSMAALALAAVDRRQRRSAALDAAVAAALAVLGVVIAAHQEDR